jgi:hypothetical protein
MSNIKLNMFCIGISLKNVMRGGSISYTEPFYLGKFGTFTNIKHKLKQ